MEDWVGCSEDEGIIRAADGRLHLIESVGGLEALVKVDSIIVGTGVQTTRAEVQTSTRVNECPACSGWTYRDTERNERNESLNSELSIVERQVARGLFDFPTTKQDERRAERVFQLGKTRRVGVSFFFVPHSQRCMKVSDPEIENLIILSNLGIRSIF